MHVDFFSSATVNPVIEMPALEEGDHSVITLFISLFTSIMVLLFCILLIVFRKKIQKCMHYTNAYQQQQQPHLLVPGEFQCFK
jgi:hypothetical protein